MTSHPAHRRHIACRLLGDVELLIGPDLVLPDLPEPGPEGRRILALFEGAGEDETAFEIEILIGPGLRLH